MSQPRRYRIRKPRPHQVLPSSKKVHPELASLDLYLSSPDFAIDSAKPRRFWNAAGYSHRG